MQVAADVFAGDGAAHERDEQIAGLGEAAFVGVDVNAAADDGSVVDFSGVGLEGADEIEVGAGFEPGAVEQRLGCAGAGTQHICFGSDRARPSGLDFGLEEVAHFAGEGGGAFCVRSANEDALEVAGDGEDAKMSSCLAAGAENAQNTYVHTGESASGGGRGSGGAKIGEDIGGNQQARLSRDAIHEQIGGLQRLAGFGRNEDEFCSQSATGDVSAGHDEKNAVRQFHLNALGLEDGTVANLEGLGDDGDQANGIEEQFDVLVG